MIWYFIGLMIMMGCSDREVTQYTYIEHVPNCPANMNPADYEMFELENHDVFYGHKHKDYYCVKRAK